MPTVEERVSTLEEILAQFIINTNRFVDEMRVFKEEMLVFKEEMLVFKEESERDRKMMNKKWGDLVNKIGSLVEDIVAPNIKGIARKYFGCEKIYDFSVRRYKRKISDSSQGREFDVIAVCEDKLVLNETKSKPNISDINNFVNLLGEIYDYFPDYKGKVLIPTFACLYLNDDVVKYLTNNKIYAMSIKDDTMEILNFELLTTS